MKISLPLTSLIGYTVSTEEFQLQLDIKINFLCFFQTMLLTPIVQDSDSQPVCYFMVPGVLRYFIINCIKIISHLLR
jgi:hypothetical protein